MPLRHLLIAILFLTLATVSESPALEPGQQTAVEANAEAQLSLRYLLYLPEDYDSQEKWPLLLFLHGSGERGSDIEKVNVHGPPKLAAAGKQFPFIVISPQCPSYRGWEISQLDALLTHVEQTLKVDPDRVYVTGLSLGGQGTWRLAASFPDRFAAIAPVCGRAETSGAERVAHIPTWIFHGGNDTAVPLQESAKMMKALIKAGGNPRITIYPVADHDSWTETYENAELYEWLLKQKRTAPERAAEAPN